MAKNDFLGGKNQTTPQSPKEILKNPVKYVFLEVIKGYTNISVVQNKFLRNVRWTSGKTAG